MNTRSREANTGPQLNGFNRITKFFIFIVLVGFVLWVGYFLYRNIFGLPLARAPYQAVFLDNNQVYFGKLTTKGDWLVLNDIYYLQATDSLQQKSVVSEAKNVNQNIQLIKLGSEIHGPMDAMYFKQDKILFWENLKENSKVLEAIKRDKSNQKIINSASQDKF